jgi:hypothetical protein
LVGSILSKPPVQGALRRLSEFNKGSIEAALRALAEERA